MIASTFLSIVLPVMSIAGYNSISTEMFPIIAIALFIDAAIVGLWYFAGAILNNNRVKSNAMGEFYQVFGTAVLVVVLTGILVIFASTFYSVTSSTSLMSPSTIFNMCKGINTTSQLTILNSSLSQTGSSLLYSSGSSGFPGFCQLVKPKSSPSLTERIDYPLAASGVILANVTNQTATNLNSFFVFDSYIGFQEKLSPTFAICIDPPGFFGVVLNCLFPTPIEPDLLIQYSITPFAGYAMIYKSLAALGDLLTAAFESFVAQLTLSAIFIYLWPYMLFSGIILRATPFTRKIGGLLIAIAVGGILFFPLIFSIEYLSLAHGLGPALGYTPGNALTLTPGSYSANDIGNYYGFGNIFTNSTYFIPNSTGEPYVTNFFIMPNISAIAIYGGCWPHNGDIFETEQVDTQHLLIPFVVVIHSIIAFANHNPTPPSGTFGIPYICNSTQALNTNYLMVRAYGVFGITAYFIPIINIIIVLTAIIGLSGLLGGDTSLAGLSRLV
ncbi:MAG: hypothetical protein M1465_01205 [Candidatus Marsarchaeota archaeon]|jgi:hypothetical protein|nr:hypothetical protein [Candidatus Marsarchaeota archaeon]